MEKEKISQFIKTNISIIIVAIISIFYIFWGSVQLHLKELNWWELLCYVATTLVFGICVVNLVGENGFPSGKNSKEYSSTRKLLIEWCNAVICLGLKDEAVSYAENDIDKDITSEKKNILHRAGIPYNEIFDENGKSVISSEFLKKTNKYTRQQKKSIKSALNLKRYDFTLFAYSSTKVIGRKKEQSETEYRSKNLIKDFVIRVVLAIISGSIMFSFSGFDAGAIIYSVFQMIMWIASGVMKRQQNYNFVVITMRDADLDRIGYLKAFAGSKGLKEVWIDDELSLEYNNNI